MRRAFAVAALLMVACPPPPPPDKSCTPASGFGAASGSDDKFAVAGDDVSITMRLSMQCPSDVDVRATVSVNDPNNMPLPLLEGEMTRVVTDRSPEQGMATVVKIRGVLPGAYHFAARFEPNLGLVQTDVVLAESFRDAGPELVVPNPPIGLRYCNHLDVSEGGLLLCLEDSTLLFSRDGQPLQTWSARAVRWGPVLWMVDGSGALTRWVERDGGFAQEPAGSILPSTVTGILAPGPDDVLFASEQFSELRRVWVADGGLVSEELSEPTVSPPAALWRSGDAYAVQSTGGSFQNFCFGRLHDGGVCSSGQKFPEPRAVANEPAGLWTLTDNPAFGVQTLSLTQGRGSRDFVLPTAWTADGGAGVVPWDAAPRLLSTRGSGDLLVVDRAGSFVLQKYPDLPMTSATSRWVTLRRSDGTLLIYRR